MAPPRAKPPIEELCMTQECGHPFGEHFVTEDRTTVGCAHGYALGSACACDGFTIIVKYGPFGLPAAGNTRAPNVPGGQRKRGRPPRETTVVPVLRSVAPSSVGDTDDGAAPEYDEDGNLIVDVDDSPAPPWPTTAGVIDESGSGR